MTPPLTLADYQTQASQTDQRRAVDGSLAFPLLGLFGEIGGLLSEVKKKQRDLVSYLGYEHSVLEEFGDVLWYLAAVADRGHIPLAELGANLDRTLSDWQSETPAGLTFLDLQHAALHRKESPTPAFERTLLELAGEVGHLMADHEAGHFDHNRSALAGRLVALLRILRDAANEAGITLHDAAQANLVKIFDRWPVDRTYPPLFDDGFPAAEQIPRELVIDIEEITEGGRTVACLSYGDQRLGDSLTDNRQEDDDYRFHDVFHLAYAAILGWSPTLRRLLKAKRKSDPAIDEAEDGARAILIEEGIATWIFNHAQRLELFRNIKALDYGLLKSIREFVKGYEAEQCPLWLWEEAIFQGFNVFRAVKEHRRGRITANLISRTVRFEPLS
jgi:NTP pyrophosphatase (non-canonical NTP hydrolase)